MKSDMGLLMNIVLGIVGAAIASAILSAFGIVLGGWLGYLIAGFIGACLLIWIVRLLRGHAQLEDGLPGPVVPAGGGNDHEAARLHHAARRRGSVAARGARAAAGEAADHRVSRRRGTNKPARMARCICAATARSLR